MSRKWILITFLIDVVGAGPGPGCTCDPRGTEPGTVCDDFGQCVCKVLYTVYAWFVAISTKDNDQ